MIRSWHNPNNLPGQRFEHFHSHDGRAWRLVGAGPVSLGAVPGVVDAVAAKMASLQNALRQESKYYQTQTLSAFLFGLALGAYTVKFKAVTTVAFAASALIVGLSANSRGQPLNNGKP